MIRLLLFDKEKETKQAPKRKRSERTVKKAAPKKRAAAKELTVKKAGTALQRKVQAKKMKRSRKN